MGLFGQSDVFFVFISVSSENKQFIKDNLGMLQMRLVLSSFVLIIVRWLIS
jgi:hypothetical protein